MKKTLSFVLALMLIFTSYLTTPAAAADGGESSLHITSPADGDVVDGSMDVKLKWSKVNGADHYWLTIKNESTGERPVNQRVDGRSYTVEADSVFVVDGGTFKVYVAAMDAQGRVLSGPAGTNSEWEAIYIRASYKFGPSLVYASPALVNPEVSISYLAERNCYYGYGGEIPCDEDLELKIENIHAPSYVLNVAILEGTPDYGGSNEAKLASLEVSKYQSSRRYTIDHQDLQKYAGRFLKVAIQPIDPDTGNYGLLAHFYFFIGNADSPEPNPEPTPDPKPNDTVFVDGVDTGYADGDYFTKNGEACTCHNQGICLVDDNKCNCLQYMEHNGRTVKLKGVQCIGWSRYIQVLLYGKHDKSDTDFQKVYADRTATASGLKETLLNCVPGTHIRTSSSKKGYAHSVSILSATSSGVTITDCNHTDECQISVRSYTYDELAEFLNNYGGVDYISVYSKGSDEQADDQPVYGGQLDITLSDVTGMPGEVVEIPISVKTPVAYLEVKVNSNLPFTVVDTGVMGFMEGNTSYLFYSGTNATGVIAKIRIQLPEDADGESFRVLVTTVEAYNAAEETLECSNVTATVTVDDPVVMGDVTGDGRINGLDAIRLCKYLLGADVYVNQKAADLNGSGKIDPVDLLRLLAMVL